MAKQKQKWADLSRRTKAMIIVVAIAQYGFMTVALADIRRRPKEQIKGSKKVWAALAFINWVGPLAYFQFGRRKSASGD